MNAAHAAVADSILGRVGLFKFVTGIEIMRSLVSVSDMPGLNLKSLRNSYV